MVTVPESLLRRATARIDSLDREVVWLKHDLAVRDSSHAWEVRDMKEHNQRVLEWGQKGWQQANSWWHQNRSAFWATLGAVAVALALRL